MPRLKGLRLSVDLPPGWDGRIFKREVAQAQAQERQAATRALLHVANFGLPPDRGDFGSGAVERMTAQQLFVSLFEYGPESVGTALFSRQGRPTFTPDDFSPQALQRAVSGQGGTQAFFTDKGRAFGLYVVVGSFRDRVRLVPQVNGVLETVQIQA